MRELPDVVRAVREMSGTSYMERVMYICEVGYSFPDGSTEVSVQCMWDETWSTPRFNSCHGQLELILFYTVLSQEVMF